MPEDRKPVSHYMQGNMEVIDVIKGQLSQEEFKGFLWGNVIKYVLRFKYKGKPIEDLEKAKTYIGWLQEEARK